MAEGVLVGNLFLFNTECDGYHGFHQLNLLFCFVFIAYICLPCHHCYFPRLVHTVFHIINVLAPQLV